MEPTKHKVKRKRERKAERKGKRWRKKEVMLLIIAIFYYNIYKQYINMEGSLSYKESLFQLFSVES